MIRADRKHNVHRSLLRWYRKNARDLPWRTTRNPYHILVSEIMLQQTQVSRVLEHYPKFLRRFPSLTSLASSTARDVIVAWNGLGYNNRAVRLRALAHTVVFVYSGVLPAEPTALSALPGIGRYTAGAILSFAFNRRVPVVDTNIRRFLSRLVRKMPSVSDRMSEPRIWKLAEQLLPRRNSREWNQAMMDLGSMICTSRTPSCDVCPVTVWCASSGAMAGPRISPRRKEPMFKGIPNRIHRGRIISVLRTSGWITIGDLGKKIVPSYKPRDRNRLTSLLFALEQDGLVRTKSGKVTLA